MRADHPFGFLVTKTIIDPDFGVSILHARDESSHTRSANAQHRVFASRLWGNFAVTILARFAEKYGPPSSAEVGAAFATPLVSGPVAEKIAHAIELYFDGACDDCAHVLAPRLETVIRELARQVGLPIIREPIGDEPGRWRPLGRLLHSLKGRLPTLGWEAHLTNLLVDPLGLNLRNVIAHGVREEIDQADSALLVHAACFLRLVRLAEQPTGS